MNKKNNFFLGIFLTVLFFVALNIFTPFSSYIKSAVIFTVSPVQKSFSDSGRSFFGFLEVFRNSHEISQEINYLRSENRRLYNEIARRNQIVEENKALRSALEIDFPEEKELTFAEIIGRDLIDQNIIIRHEGIANVNSAVVTPEGVLVGIVEKANRGHSIVRLITSSQSAFEVKIQNEENPIGVISGSDNRTLKVNYLPRNKTVERGNIVLGVTREDLSLGGIYIGRVIEVIDSDVEAFSQAKVLQGIDIRQIEHLFVVDEKNH